MSPIVWGLAHYVGIQLLIGILVSRRVRSEDDFLVAGRRLRTPLSAASIFATWFGAETCVSSASEAFDSGVGWHSVEPFAYGLCLVLLGLFFAAPLWRTGITTLADLFRSRYSGRVERLAALLLIPTSVLWAAAQIRAFGHVVASSTGLSIGLAVTIAALVAIVYTGMGGILADVWTDFVQAGALIVGLVFVLVGVVASAGGWEATLARIDLARVDFTAPVDGEWLATVETWALPLCGSVVAQEAVSRSLASRSASVARRSALIGGGRYLMLGSIPLLLGLVGAGLHPDLVASEEVLPVLARERLSTIGYVVFAGALVSAILSTVDSTLLAAASLLERNLLLGGAAVSDARRLAWARAGVVIFGLAALGLALAVESVADLVEHASGFASAGVLVVVVFGLFTRLGGERSALAALVAGGAAWIAGAYVIADFAYPYLASLAAALGAYLVAATRSAPAVHRIT